MSETETVRVQVLLLFGEDAEVRADAADWSEPERYPAAEIAAALGVAAKELPGMRMLADVGPGDRLTNWRLP
ncbi:hypothetical protein ABIA32_002711 [Streptacidiphilus sp. MAP12-20]|uniref:hypothetical protein n=1 Tax=Streptacidiphilus sp. MAP12-20 TaxID=3156299 RepID=UPI003518E66C